MADVGITAITVLKRGRKGRLAVIDNSGRLVGLLDLKRNGSGLAQLTESARRAGEAAEGRELQIVEWIPMTRSTRS